MSTFVLLIEIFIEIFTTNRSTFGRYKKNKRFSFPVGCFTEKLYSYRGMYYL